MKIISIFISITFLAITACGDSSNKEEVTLTGTIDTKVNGIIQISFKGNKVKGVFKNQDTGEKIDLRGTYYQEKLRIEEFAKKDQLTGVFDGNYKEDQYRGSWISPDGKIKTPFIFVNESLVKNDIPVDSKENIKQAFLKWAKAKNNTDEYCSEQQCLEDLKRQSNGLDPIHKCGYRIAQEIKSENIHYSDLNGDGITDAIITADYQQCMYGTWFINVAMKGFLTFFMSTKNSGYTIIEEPPVIEKNIGIGRIIALNKDTIIAEGGSITGENGFHNIDISWKAKFLYEKDRFRLVSKTKEVYKEQ